MAESFLQFADHYYRLQKEIEINNEAKETRINNETQSSEEAVSEAETDKNDKRPPRRKRGFQIREKEIKEAENNIENKDQSKETVTKSKKSSYSKKKKVKKNIVNGIAYVQSTFNNTIVSIADTQGNVVSWASAGQKGFKGSRKSTPYAAQIAADSAAICAA